MNYKCKREDGKIKWVPMQSEETDTDSLWERFVQWVMDLMFPEYPLL